MDITLTDIILEGELLKDKALIYNDDNFSEAEIIEKVHDEAEEWIKKTKEVLLSSGLNQSINLNEPSWESLCSYSREALFGFVEKRLIELRRLINNQNIK